MGSVEPACPETMALTSPTDLGKLNPPPIRKGTFLIQNTWPTDHEVRLSAPQIPDCVWRESVPSARALMHRAGSDRILFRYVG